jgi:hypothetical protein
MVSRNFRKETIMKATVHPIQSKRAALSGKPLPLSVRSQAAMATSLIDVTEVAVKAGFTSTVVITPSAWDEVIAWSCVDGQRRPAEHMASRLWNVIWVLRCHLLVKRHRPIPELRFEVHCIPDDMKWRRSRATVLKAVLQPGYAGEAVIAIMLPRED